MPVVLVASETPGAGKTAVAAAIARHYAYQGLPVRLARVWSDAPGSNAEEDARYFSGLAFAPGSSAHTCTWLDVYDPDQGVLVVEADGLGKDAPARARVVQVQRAESAAQGVEGAAATVVTRVHGITRPEVAGEEGGPVTVRLPEDRTLNGFSVAELQAMLHAETLVPGDAPDATCDQLVIAPIGSDAGQPYFRRFGAKAVLARFDKTDMHLAALQSDPVVLVLTGGRRPSEYLFDAAGAKGVPVLLSRTDTENTVIALERIFDRTRFVGERKLDRISELLEATPLFAALAVDRS